MPPGPPAEPAAAPLKVAVMVTLERGQKAGGHVKCWERFAEAAATLPAALDLTLHFLGDRDETVVAAPNVRFRHHPPAFGTKSVPFLRQGGGDTDLAPRHRGLGRELPAANLLHATDFFSFGRTALATARARNLAVTASVHTDVPRFVGIYAGDVLAQICGRALARQMTARFRVQDRLAAMIGRGIDRRLTGCDRVLVSKMEDHARLAAQMAPGRVSFLRRGIDRLQFNPRHRDRERLARDFGIPADRPVLLFVGRIDGTKSPMTLAAAARHLLDRGIDLQVLAVGDGEQRQAMAALLGPRATLPGNLPQSDLGRIYAGADTFVFPSETEVSPNVVLEAKASGLPVVVAADHGGGQFVAESGRDGIVISGQDPAAWAAAIGALLADNVGRRAMGKAARDWAETRWPSWLDVLREDLLPVWQAAAAAKGGRAR